MPISTLKLNARQLKQLGMIDHSFSGPVGLTNFGRMVLGIISQDSSIGRVRGRNPRGPDSSSGPETLEGGKSDA